jgi:hypothetical protein
LSASVNGAIRVAADWKTDLEEHRWLVSYYREHFIDDIRC